MHAEKEEMAAGHLEAKLKIALDALTEIANETDLTCMRALFKMQRRAEEALLKIGRLRTDQHTLF